MLSADCGLLIDPIDGTNNFIKGDEKFAVMAVALQRGEAVARWIFLPSYNKLAVAEKGGGSYINDKRIEVPSAPQKMKNLIGAAHINRMPEPLRLNTRKNLQQIKENRPAYCAGYDYVAITEA